MFSETVLLQSGVSISIQDVQVGDQILAANRFGNTLFSPVISIPHGKNKLKAVFHEITTISGHQVRMSSGHVVPAGPCGDGFIDVGDTKVLPLVTALQAQVGFCVYNLDGVKEKIVSNKRVYGEGIYSLVTEEEMIVVGGVVASPFAFSHHVPSRFYDAYRLAYRVMPQLLKSKAFIALHQGFGEFIKEMFHLISSRIIS